MNQDPAAVANRHFLTSVVKSALRIGAGIFLVAGVQFLLYAGLLFVVAEIFGIAEEIVGT